MTSGPEFSIPRLTPQRVMGRNDPCWCLSGKKWKHCHRGRELLPRANVFDGLAKMDEEFAKGYCLHPDASPANCSSIVQAHTVQRRGGLAAIAENNHVTSIKLGGRRIADNRGEFQPTRLGINKASTFPGFCGKHDTEMFRAVENGTVTINGETAFRLSYRAIAYEYFSKESAIRSYDHVRLADSGRPFEEQCFMQDYINSNIHGLRLGLVDLKMALSKYIEIFKSGDFSSFHYYGITFFDVLPVVSAGAISPEYDFLGKDIQNILRSDIPIEQAAFNLTTFDGRSIVIFGWLEAGGPAEKVAASLRDSPTDRKANAVVSFAFEYLENTMMRPSWWDGLPERVKRAALAHFTAGHPGREYGHDLLSRSASRPTFISSAILSEAWH